MKFPGKAWLMKILKATEKPGSLSLENKLLKKPKPIVSNRSF